MAMKEFGAVIVAAGLSSRMEAFKPLLEFNGKSAIVKLIESYKQAEIEKIVVVTGHQKDRIEEEISGYAVDIVENPNYEQGMFTSVQKGISSLEDTVKAFFMHPADIPLVKPYTLAALKKAYDDHSTGIVYPVYKGRKGHPPLISLIYRQEIMKSEGKRGLKGVLKPYEDAALFVDVSDPTVLMDMDYSEDYQRLIDYDSKHLPDEKECYKILDYLNTPKHVVAHSIAVKERVSQLYQELFEAGLVLNKDLLIASALLHDALRHKKNHAEEGAIAIKRLGYDSVADIVALHMEINVNENEELREAELLYYADKTVDETKWIDIDRRFCKKMKEQKPGSQGAKRVAHRWHSALQIEEKIYKLTGCLSGR